MEFHVITCQSFGISTNLRPLWNFWVRLNNPLPPPPTSRNSTNKSLWNDPSGNCFYRYMVSKHGFMEDTLSFIIVAESMESIYWFGFIAYQMLNMASLFWLLLSKVKLFKLWTDIDPFNCIAIDTKQEFAFGQSFHIRYLKSTFTISFLCLFHQIIAFEDLVCKIHT